MVVFDKNEEQIVATLKGHTKKVTSVIYHPSQVTSFLFICFKHQPVKSFSNKSSDLFYSYCLLCFPSSPWSSLRLQTPPSACGPSPGATASRWCVPTRQVSLDSPYMLLGTTCSAPPRIRYECSLTKIRTEKVISALHNTNFSHFFLHCSAVLGLL